MPLKDSELEEILEVWKKLAHKFDQLGEVRLRDDARYIVQEIIKMLEERRKSSWVPRQLSNSFFYRQASFFFFFF